MKHVLLAGMILVFCASSVFAADFAPTLLSLSADPAISYDFGGSSLEIPVTVTGTPALTHFFVFTKDKANTVQPVQNGYLGWHFVNKIDTCMYMSDEVQLQIGSNKLTWDGNDDDGNAVAAGVYTYYIWGYDNITDRYPAVDIKKNYPEDSSVWNLHPGGGSAAMMEWGEDGNALANPVFTKSTWRWTMGNDPLDPTLLEKSAHARPEGWTGTTIHAIQLDNWENQYLPMRNPDSVQGGVWKYQWVPGGDAILDIEWGESGGVTWTMTQQFHTNVSTDGNYLYMTANTYKEETAHNELWVIDYEEGEVFSEFDIAEFWTDPGDYEAGAQMSGGPGTQYMRDGLLFLGCHCSCMRQVVDPTRGLEDEDDLVLYVNNNGDYVMDHNFEEDADKAWVCNDFNVGPYTYTFTPGAEHFALTPAFDMGAVSFAILAPDGTGIGYFAFAGETANQKFGICVIDNGSAFDGYYVTKNEAQKEGDGTSALSGTYYAAFDEISGTISTGVSVNDDAAAFSVAQNSPNPFNPSTTISFSIQEAGTVSVDVFNVAGQKIDTIANEFMNTGSHSMTWDASGFSAGVYFYTVKTGDFSKTLKMTLLK